MVGQIAAEKKDRMIDSPLLEKTIAAEDDGIRLDRWFKRHLPSVPHSRLENLLRRGAIRVEDAKARAGQRLRKGERLRLPKRLKEGAARRSALPPPPPPSRRESADLKARILHRDHDVIVINKPAGLAAQGGSRVSRHLDGLLDALRFDAAERPKLVHRLDKEASGVLILARTAAAAAHLAERFRKREVRKIYWALTISAPKETRGRLVSPIAPEKEGGDEKRARTDYVLARKAGQRFAWLALMTHTGRKHQIRIHLSEIGTPVVGDKKYGKESAAKGLGRGLHLHAREMSLRLPSGKILTARAPLPPHMEESWRILDFDLKGALWENSAALFKRGRSDER